LDLAVLFFLLLYKVKVALTHNRLGTVGWFAFLVQGRVWGCCQVGGVLIVISEKGTLKFAVVG
jgi:hypothetical protein